MNPEPAARTIWVIVSVSDDGRLAVCRLDPQTGALTEVSSAPAAVGVMPLAWSPDGRYLYAAIRAEPFHVVAYSFDATSGRLSGIGTAPLPGSMAYLRVDPSGGWLLAASYPSHHISTSRLLTDACPRPPHAVVATGRHAHAVVLDDTGRHLVVPCLGSDELLQFDFDARTGMVSPASGGARLPGRPGAGPRHMALHPNGRDVYLLNECDASIERLERDLASGLLRRVCHWDWRPGGDTTPWAADLHLRPDGRFLYASERRSSKLGVWAVAPDSGDLRRVSETVTELQPRSFAVARSGRWLVAAGQLSAGIAAYRIDAASGALTWASRLAIGRNPSWVEIVEVE